VAGLVSVAGLGVGDPPFQVRLRAGVQRQPVAGQPVEEVGRRGDVAAHIQVLKTGGVSLAEAPSESAKVVPDRVAVQDPPLCRVGAGLDRCGDPAFQGDETLVAGRQYAGGDQDAA
jgi:hypothetical protein